MGANSSALPCCSLWIRLYISFDLVAVSLDNCTCCAVAVDPVFRTSDAISCRNWLVVFCCYLIFANSASVASFSATNWSMCACIRTVGGRVGAGVDLRVALFLP